MVQQERGSDAIPRPEEAHVRTFGSMGPEVSGDGGQRKGRLLREACRGDARHAFQNLAPPRPIAPTIVSSLLLEHGRVEVPWR